jgi:hypothetical protein
LDTLERSRLPTLDTFGCFCFLTFGHIRAFLVSNFWTRPGPSDFRDPDFLGRFSKPTRTHVDPTCILVDPPRQLTRSQEDPTYILVGQIPFDPARTHVDLTCILVGHLPSDPARTHVDSTSILVGPNRPERTSIRPAPWLTRLSNRPERMSIRPASWSIRLPKPAQFLPTDQVLRRFDLHPGRSFY